MNKLIKFQDLTPEVYYKKSRDFQYIGRLFDLVLNNAKMNTDIISSLPLNPDMDPRLLDLLALTLGFKSKHEYNTKQLAALCSIFPLVLRNKGSKFAIETACNALLNAEGITKKASIEVKNQTISIFLSSELSDLNLLKDLLNYILPAGMSFLLIREATLVPPSSKTSVGYNDHVVNYTDTSKASKVLWAEAKNKSAILKQTGTDATNAKESRAKDHAGVFVNTSILRQTPEPETPKPETPEPETPEPEPSAEGGN